MKNSSCQLPTQRLLLQIVVPFLVWNIGCSRALFFNLRGCKTECEGGRLLPRYKMVKDCETTTSICSVMPAFRAIFGYQCSEECEEEQQEEEPITLDVEPGEPSEPFPIGPGETKIFQVDLSASQNPPAPSDSITFAVDIEGEQDVEDMELYVRWAAPPDIEASLWDCQSSQLACTMLPEEQSTDSRKLKDNYWYWTIVNTHANDDTIYISFMVTVVHSADSIELFAGEDSDPIDISAGEVSPVYFLRTRHWSPAGVRCSMVFDGEVEDADLYIGWSAEPTDTRYDCTSKPPDGPGTRQCSIWNHQQYGTVPAVFVRVNAWKSVTLVRITCNDFAPIVELVDNFPSWPVDMGSMDIQVYEFAVSSGSDVHCSAVSDANHVIAYMSWDYFLELGSADPYPYACDFWESREGSCTVSPPVGAQKLYVFAFAWHSGFTGVSVTCSSMPSPVVELTSGVPSTLFSLSDDETKFFKLELQGQGDTVTCRTMATPSGKATLALRWDGRPYGRAYDCAHEWFSDEDQGECSAFFQTHQYNNDGENHGVTVLYAEVKATEAIADIQVICYESVEPIVDLSSGVASAPPIDLDGGGRLLYRLPDVDVGETVTCRATTISGDPELYLRWSESPKYVLSGFPEMIADCHSTQDSLSEEEEGVVECTAPSSSSLYVSVHADGCEQSFSGLILVCTVE